jgi:ribosomal protein S28E/S33
MIIALRERASEAEVVQVCRRVKALGHTPHISRRTEMMAGLAKVVEVVGRTVEG